MGDTKKGTGCVGGGNARLHNVHAVRRACCLNLVRNNRAKAGRVKTTEEKELGVTGEDVGLIWILELRGKTQIRVK